MAKKTQKVFHPCDNCGCENARHLEGNYCAPCADAFRARIRRDPETRPVGRALRTTIETPTPTDAELLAEHDDTKARLPLRDRLLARTRHQVIACYSTCGYRVSESRWAGGEHSTDVVVVQTPTAGGARGDSSWAWSKNGKWRGTNSTHQITVDWSWLRTVRARGIATVDGMLTLSARPCDGLRDGETAYTARWVQQGRGVSLQTRDGVIYRAGEEWMHAQTLQGARRSAVGRIAAAQAERERAAKAVADIEAEIVSLRGLTIHRSDIPSGVACASGVADWIAKSGLDADTCSIDAADLLRLAVASSDRVDFVRRIIVHAQQLSQHKAA